MSSLPQGQPTAYYEPLGDGGFRSTVHAQGAWTDTHQHMAPVSGLLVDALLNCGSRPELVISRVTFDILGVIPAGDFMVSAQVIRPGRSIELVQAEMISSGRTVVRATAWRLATSDTSAVAGSDLRKIPGPEQGKIVDVSAMWPGGYIRSLEFLTVGPQRPGRGTVWLRSAVDLIAGAQTSDLAGLFALIDTANGVSVRALPGEVQFPNTDLTVHFFRQPTGTWLGLDTEVTFGAGGIGLTAAVLHDLDGPFGRSAQTLTIRAMG